MVKKRKTLFFGLLCCLLLAVAAEASLTYLPESSHYSGKSYYNVDVGGGKIISGRIEFAVYDTQQYPSEFAGYTAPGDGRYIYAYQIINYNTNDYGMTNDAVAYFAIEDIGLGAILSTANIGTADGPGSGDIDATDEYFNPDLTRGIFEFDGGILVPGNDSWFLLLRSHKDYKTGTYSFAPPTNDDDVPVPDKDGENPIPEPTSTALLLTGIFCILKRKTS